MPSISSFFNKKTETETNTNLSHEEIKTDTKTTEDIGKDGRLTRGHSAKENTNNAKGETFNASNLTLSPSTTIVPPGSCTESIEGSSGDKTARILKLRESAVSKKKGIAAFFSGSVTKSGEVKLENEERTPRNPYQDCEIDCSVLESLPDDIRREIQQSLLTNNERIKGAKQERNFFGSLFSSTAKATISDSSLNKETHYATDDDSMNCDPMEDCTDLIKCEKCGAKLSHWEMPEHSDYHFALELQKGEKPSSAAKNSEFSITEPPKKKRRTTIQSFFTPK